MKQIIPFVKDIGFNTNISEITSIALEHNLQMENNDSVVGTFTVSGKYKINDISINEEEFLEKIPFDITLDDKYDATKVEIDIDNFYYEIINEDKLRVHIDVLANNLVCVKKEEVKIEEVKKEQKEEIIMPEEIDILKNNKEIDDSKILEEENLRGDRVIVPNKIKEEIKIDDEEMGDVPSATEVLTGNFLNTTDNYVMYKVHIIRESETIEMILEKYGITKEELEKYNDLNDMTIGNKIIIPYVDEQ